MLESTENKSKAQKKEQFNFMKPLVLETDSKKKPINLNNEKYILQKAHPCIFPRAEMSIDSTERKFPVQKASMMKNVINHSDTRFNSQHFASNTDT